MKRLAYFIKKYPVIQSNYEKQVVEMIRQKKSELKAKVPEHRWWEVDDIDAMELDLSVEEKDRLRKSGLYTGMLEIIDHKGIDSAELDQVLYDLECVAKTLNDTEKEEMEMMLSKEFANNTFCLRKIHNLFYKTLGSEKIIPLFNNGVKTSLFTETHPGKYCKGTVFVNAIKSHIAPDRKKMLEMLDFFENGKWGNTDLSDVGDHIVRVMGRHYKQVLNLADFTSVSMLYYAYDATDYDGLDLEEFREILDWMVLDLLSGCDDELILPSEVPMIREFLETPAGKEEEAVKKWLEYWKKVDFEERKGVAPL